MIRICQAARFLMLWLSLTLGLSAAAIENPVFDHLGTGQGLSQGNITALAQDRHGFIWVGTQEGLNRYDGRTVKSFLHSPGDPGSLSHDYISDLLVDDSGRLWVATMGGGLLLLAEREQEFSSFSGFEDDEIRLTSSRIRLLYKDEKGVIWAGTDADGLFRIDNEQQNLTHYGHDEDDPTSVADNRIRAIESDIQGRLWVGTEGGGVSLMDETGQRFEHFRHDKNDPESLGSDNVMSLFAASDGTIWAGTYDRGLSIINPFRHKVSRFEHDPADYYSIAAQRIRAITMDETGRIWLATDGGLNLWDPDRRGFHKYVHEAGVTKSLSDNRVTTLMQDAGGVLWVGTYSGLNKWNARIGSVEHYRVLPGAPGGLSSGVVTSFAEDAMGGLWVGTWGGGINFFGSPGSEIVHYRAGTESGSLSDDRVMSMLVDSDNQLWVGTRGHGLDRFEPGSGQFMNLHHDPEVATSLSSNAITRIFEDSSKRLWVGTFGGGANRLADDGFVHLQHDPQNSNSLGSDRVLDIKESSDGAIWFATDGGGVSILGADSGQILRITAESGTKVGDLSSDSVITMLMTTDDIWLGTKDAGLDRLAMSDYLDGNFNFVNYNRQTGLPSNAVWGLLQDDTGMIWVSTNRGVSALAPESDSIRNFTVAHGLQGDEFNSGAYFKSADGTLFFGGSNGFNRFNPRNLLLSTNTHSAPVVLVGLTVFGKPYVSQETLQDLRQLKLGYDDYVVGFEFTMLDFTGPEANRYQYRLEGLEQDWNGADRNNRATYTNLEPGDYVFRVRAANSDGYQSANELAIDLNVAAPPWRTRWAYAVEVLLGFLIIYGVIRVVSARAHRRAEHKANDRMRMYINCLEEASDAVAIVNPDGVVIYANQAFNQMAPATGDQTSILKDRLFANAAEAAQALEAVNADGRWRGEVGQANENERTLDVFLTRVEQSVLGETPIIAVARDISERKQSEVVLGRYRDRLEILVHKRTQELEHEITHHRETEDRLRLSLKEKELLLKEVHHRVKNNMQVVSSLLNIQAEGSQMPELVDALNESQNRIRSMALIHESLYQSDNLLEIDFDEYVRMLTGTLVRVWAVPNVEVIIQTNAEGVFLDIDKAVPCGLIINELVSNALKHAFKGREGSASICIDVERIENNFRIRVADDGVGFPEDLDFRDAPSMGMEIVCVLTTQLDGEIELERHNGSRFSIVFPAEEREVINA